MSNPVETAEIAAVLIVDGEGRRLLADFNAGWRSFAIPMSKRRPQRPAHEDDTSIEEPLEAAAVRAATEVLGRPLLPSQMPRRLAVEVPPYGQSGRDGRWKRYHYTLFAMRVDRVPTPLDGHAAVWLTPKEIESGEPVSPTAREILRAVPFGEVCRAVGL